MATDHAGSITFEQLKQRTTGGAVAIRVSQRLQPAGGPGDKVFPPTYATGDKALKYAREARFLDGKEVGCVLLDSVASQANRMEEALLAAWERSRLDFPVVGVDFSQEPGLEDLATLTALQAPHRLADAILRDATDAEGKTLFRDLPEGRAYTEASPKNATAVYALCPTALIFGVWDSTGPKGGLGAKFQRALTSEIVAVGVVGPGRKVSSRLDPLSIPALAIYEAKESKDGQRDWTSDVEQAKRDAKSNPIPYSGDAKKSKASAINHSNIAPSIDELAGGVSFEYAQQTIVLSLPALRRLRFVTALDGKPLAHRAQAEDAARVALAALALAAITHLRDQGFDLRSRCLLVPETGLVLQVIDGDGKTTDYALTSEQADALVEQAADEAAKKGLSWVREPLKLRPAKKLADLVRLGRERQAAGEVTEEA